MKDPFAGREETLDEEQLRPFVVDGHDALLRYIGNEFLQPSWPASDGTR